MSMEDHIISDEQLAAFMENNAIGFGDEVFNALDLDDAEAVIAASKAMEMFPDADVAKLPYWMDNRGIAASSVPRFSGFMADMECCCNCISDDDDLIEEEEDDRGR